MSIETLKQALELLAVATFHSPELQARRTEVINAGLSAIEQMEKQEPVAWREFDGEGGYEYYTYEYNEDLRDKYIERNGEKYASWVEPLYTTPPEAQPAPVQEPVAIVSGYYGGQCVVLPTNPARLFNSGTAFYTAPPAPPAAPVQEPVAWIRWEMGSDGKLKQIELPLTTPPAAQRQWVGLTDEQKRELVTNWFAEGWAIKAAHGMLDDYDTVLRELNGGQA